MPNQKSKSDRLSERIRRYPSHDRLLLMRNLGYGGAAACLVILLGLTQIGTKFIALKISVFSASIALPFWLLIGTIYEYYIFLGKLSYLHLRTKFLIGLVGFSFVVASLGIAIATGGVIWFLLPEAAYAFSASGLIAFALGGIFQAHLARWWFREAGSSEKDDDV
jgi:hypothetical protein